MAFRRCFEDHENVYILLEECSHRTLSDVSKESGRLPQPVVAAYIRQVLSGLIYLHGAPPHPLPSPAPLLLHPSQHPATAPLPQNLTHNLRPSAPAAERVIHRDVKLGNVFLAQDGATLKARATSFPPPPTPPARPPPPLSTTLPSTPPINPTTHPHPHPHPPQIGDFGLACRLEHPSERKKTICGTPNYIAPEVLLGSKSTGHSFEVDVWSLGVMAFALLAGKPPFQTSDVQATYRRIKNGEYAIPEYFSVRPRDGPSAHSAPSLRVPRGAPGVGILRMPAGESLSAAAAGCRLFLSRRQRTVYPSMTTEECFPLSVSCPLGTQDEAADLIRRTLSPKPEARPTLQVPTSARCPYSFSPLGCPLSFALSVFTPLTFMNGAPLELFVECAGPERGVGIAG